MPLSTRSVSIGGLLCWITCGPLGGSLSSRGIHRPARHGSEGILPQSEVPLPRRKETKVFHRGKANTRWLHSTCSDSVQARVFFAYLSRCMGHIPLGGNPSLLLVHRVLSWKKRTQCRASRILSQLLLQNTSQLPTSNLSNQSRLRNYPGPDDGSER